MQRGGDQMPGTPKKKDCGASALHSQPIPEKETPTPGTMLEADWLIILAARLGTWKFSILE